MQEKAVSHTEVSSKGGSNIDIYNHLVIWSDGDGDGDGDGDYNFAF